MTGRLAAELPTMAALDARPDTVPADQMAGSALRLARLWRRLAEHHTWRPVADAVAVRETLASLGWSVTIDDAAVEDWLDLTSRRDRGPALIRAGHGARHWMNRQDHTDPLAMDGLFLAACLWRDAGFGRDIPLPFWSAPTQLHHRLSLRVGTEWQASFLACVAAAARAAREELAGLQRAETAGTALAAPHARTCPGRSITCFAPRSSPRMAWRKAWQSRHARPSACSDNWSPPV